MHASIACSELTISFPADQNSNIGVFLEEGVAGEIELAKWNLRYAAVGLILYLKEVLRYQLLK
jgi:hypothetical protein